MITFANSLDPDQAGQITFANSLDPDQAGQIIFANSLDPDQTGQIIFANSLDPDQAGQITFANRLDPDQAGEITFANTGPRSRVGNMFAYRCESDCRTEVEVCSRPSPTFAEIDHKIISMVILLPSAEPFKKGCCSLQAKVCARSTG